MIHLLTDTVTLASQTGVSEAGEPTYAAKRTIRARVENGRDRTAEDVDHDAVVYTTEAVAPLDRIWLPGDDTSDASAARRAAKISYLSDPGGGLTLFVVLV